MVNAVPINSARDTRIEMTDNSMNSHCEKDDQLIVLNYFRLIDEKDMSCLLNLFTEDCMIYEPFSRGLLSDEGKGKKPLKGRNEIESFFHVVMMASDGLKHEIEFVCPPFEKNRQMGDSVSSTSSSVVTAVVTFYSNEGGNKLKQKLVFHIVSEQKYYTIDKLTHYANNKDIDKDKRRIERLCVYTFNG
jgi:Nuclear transport factor 2 (NTF2) domain